MRPPSTLADPRARIFVDASCFADMDSWHATAAELRRDRPVVRAPVEGPAPLWIVTRLADIRRISGDQARFLNTDDSVFIPFADHRTTRSGATMKTLSHMDGESHLAHRRLLREWFLPANLMKWRDRIAAIAEESVDRLHDLGGECDFAKEIGARFPLRVIMKLMGIPERDEDLMLELASGLFASEDPDVVADPKQREAKIILRVLEFARYFARVSAALRREPTDDLASVIANGRIDGKALGDLETLGFYILFATAGHYTSASALNTGVEVLLRHREQLDTLRADPALIDNAIDEVLRWSAPVRHFLRHATEDVEIGGAPIRAGDRLLLSYPSACRDEEWFADPGRFDIRRPNADLHCAFGHGVHACLGARLARLELGLLLRAFLRRIESVELAGTPAWAESCFVGGVKRLPIRYELAAGSATSR